MTLDPKALEAAQEAFSANRGRPTDIRVREAVDEYKRAREAQGYVEVPVEPTPEMVAKALPIVDQPPDHMTARIAERALFMLEPDGVTRETHSQGFAAAVSLIVDYRAMLAARPQREG